MIVAFDEVLTVLGVASGSDGAALAALIHRKVERLVKNFVGYNIEQKDHVEFLPAVATRPAVDSLVDYAEPSPYGMDVLQLQNIPVRSVASVYLNESAWDTAGGSWPIQTLLEGGSWALDIDDDDPVRRLSFTGHLSRPGGASWPFLSRCVKVTYTAGWTPDELEDEASDFQLAVYQSCQKFYNEMVANKAATDTAGTGGVAVEELDGQKFTWARAADNMGLKFDLPESVKRLLEPRVRHSRLFG